MVYVMIDKDIHGKVTPENFCKLWPEDGGEIAKQVSSIIDDDGDGNLSFEEILAFRGNSTFLPWTDYTYVST